MREEDRESKPFGLPVNNLSPQMKSPGRLFKLFPVGSEVPIGQVKLPAEGSRFIILLVVTKTGAKGRYNYKPVVIPSDGSFRPGDVYLHNASNVPVLGKIGDRSLTLAPRKGRIHRPTGAVNELYYDIAFAIRKKEGKNRYLTTSRWPVTNRSRSYVIFYRDPSTKRIRFRAVDELLPRAE